MRIADSGARGTAQSGNLKEEKRKRASANIKNALGRGDIKGKRKGKEEQARPRKRTIRGEKRGGEGLEFRSPRLKRGSL